MKQVYDGQWIRPYMKKFKMECCDCGLVHNVEFKKLRQGIACRFTRNDKLTAAARKRP